MNKRALAALACLLAGIPLAAWALAGGQLLLALLGLALVLAALYMGAELVAKASEPKHPLKPAAKPAWSMKDEAQPPDGPHPQDDAQALNQQQSNNGGAAR